MLDQEEKQGHKEQEASQVALDSQEREGCQVPLVHLVLLAYLVQLESLALVENQVCLVNLGNQDFLEKEVNQVHLENLEQEALMDNQVCKAPVADLESVVCLVHREKLEDLGSRVSQENEVLYE